MDNNQLCSLKSNHQKEATRNQIVLDNSGLVYGIASRYKSNNIDTDDIIQEGMIGLINAAEKFDGSKGNEFSTYACSCIKNQIVNYIRKNSGLIALPKEVNNIIYEIEKAKGELYSEHGIEPTTKEIADYFNMDITYIEGLLQFKMPINSLDNTIPEDEESDYFDLIADENAISPETEVLEESDIDYLNNILETLPPKEKAMICLYFGFGGKAYSLSEIGKQFNMTKEGVRKAIDRTINSIKPYFNTP